MVPAAGAPAPSGHPSLAAAIGSMLMLVVIGYAWLLDGSFPDLYYRSVQEDESLEWATFWAFVAAAVGFMLAARRQRQATGALPWFFIGAGLFCFFVAGEEVSWGQRVVGYRPPEYFLERNFQQELNLHNIASSDLRQLALKIVILGYGLVLPLLALIPQGARLLHRIGVVAPAWPLAVGFVASYLLYEAYPWRFSGEWVEMMVGLGFLFAAVIHLRQFQRPDTPSRWWKAYVPAVVLSWLAVISAGVAHAAVTRAMVSGDDQLLTAVATELQALKSDFDSGRVRSRCGVHKRLYSFRTKYKQDYLLEGAFAKLTERGLPEARAEFLLDPWNSPYWIRDRCDGNRRVRFVYSFGPDRRRQSSRWEILGDDIGVPLDPVDARKRR